ncbi:MAG: hypothetical protein DSM106950_25310 [Stigonema ocellatum SAG 48.90 = DSM 106950]|nr:hypothetical protein [Stigonema ocellatum SAG 48.90 = DSM 106950]
MSTSTLSNHDSQSTWTCQLTKSCYQVAQQVEFLNLQAEVEYLLQKLQNLKRQRLSATSKDE